MKKILFIDFETSTLPDKIKENINLIAQAGYFYVELDDNGNILKTDYNEEFIKPDIKIVPEAQKVNNISNIDIGLVPDIDGKYKDIPSFKESKIIKKILEYLKDKEVFLGGHYLKNELKLLKKNGIEITNPLFDTIKITERYFFNQDTFPKPGSLNLQFLRSFLNTQNENIENFSYKLTKKYFPDYKKFNPHQALYDAFDSFLLSAILNNFGYIDYNKQIDLSKPEKYLLKYVPRGKFKGLPFSSLSDKDLFNMLAFFSDHEDIQYSIIKELENRNINLSLDNINDYSLIGEKPYTKIKDLSDNFLFFILIVSSTNPLNKARFMKYVIEAGKLPNLIKYANETANIKNLTYLQKILLPVLDTMIEKDLFPYNYTGNNYTTDVFIPLVKNILISKENLLKYTYLINWDLVNFKEPKMNELEKFSFNKQETSKLFNFFIKNSDHHLKEKLKATNLIVKISNQNIFNFPEITSKKEQKNIQYNNIEKD